MTDMPSPFPQCPHHPPPYTPVTTSRRQGETLTDTPLRPSSSLSTSAPTPKSNPSYVGTSNQNTPATPAPTRQSQMDKYIESELCGAIFHDPRFLERFLSGDRARLDRIHEACQNQDDYYRINGHWKFPSKIRTEKSLYLPVQDILNTIKRAVDKDNTSTHATAPSPSSHGTPSPNSDNSYPPPSDSDISSDYVPEQPLFVDTSKYTMPSDRAETRWIKPDLVLFEDVGEHRHWEHVRMPVEVKQQPGHQKAAMKQVSRYARAIFAHQPHRRHLYTLIICGAEATFVRFDRVGILYSRPINLRRESNVFTEAFASWLMLDETDQGYDPTFSWRLNYNGRLQYYIHLPESAFMPQASSNPSAYEEIPTLRFLVVDRLCHRRSICGRATIVLCIRKVGENGDEEQGDEYILKIMWRDPKRALEGDVLLKVKGKFGLAQHVWHGDGFGKCRCSPKVNGRWSCRKCVAETVQLDKLQICSNLTDIAVEVPLGEGDEDPKLGEVDTSICRPTSKRRPRRICTFIVISSKGIPLERAESPRQFIQAVLDAILGYWALFNLGFLHRDISEGNVLALSPAEQFDWEDYDLDKLEPTDEVLIKSQELLRKLLNQFRGRGPTGMLSDFDLHAQHSLYLPVLPTTDTANPGFPNTTEEGHIVAAGSHFSTPSGPSSSCTSGLVRPREEDTVEDTREPKRRKVVSHPDSMHTTTQAKLTHTHPSGSGNAENQLIDFRTGTPAFMSIRVITVPAGEKYHHSFLDDMESFFWLILWSAAAHLDNGVQHPTARAQNMLDLLNQSNPFGMAGFKKGQLADCVEDIAMRIVLQEFGNSWASDRIFTNVIVNFGKLVYRYHFAVLAKKDPSPVDVFPAVVKVFLDALSDDSE